MRETIQKKKDFLEIINFTKASVSRDELKPALQGVLLKINTNQIIGVSTDGHRLSRIIIEGKNDQTKEHEIIVPIKFLTLLNSFIDNKNKIELEISENYISISHNNQTISRNHPYPQKNHKHYMHHKQHTLCFYLDRL